MRETKLDSVFAYAMAHCQQPPSFFIYGESQFVLERFAIETAQNIEQTSCLQFRGSVKYFSVKMPFLSNQEQVNTFVDKIDQSMSVAQDIYSTFVGVVIIVLSSEWVENGINSFFSCLPDYIFTHSQNSYIVLIEANNEEYASELEKIRQSLYRSALWVDLQSPRFELNGSLQHCTDLLCTMVSDMASDLGLSLSGEVVEMLPSIVNQLDTSISSPDQVVYQTLLQIGLNKKLQNEEMIIRFSDLRLFPVKKIQNKKAKIGFSFDK